MIEPVKVSVAEGIRFSVFGKRFPTREEAIVFRDGVIAARTKSLGRAPTMRELVTGGPVKPDTRTASEKARDAAWKVTTGDEPEVDGNPYRKKPAEPKSFREGLRRQMETKWDERAEEADKRAERAADPARQRAIRFAEDHLEKTVWSPNTTQGDVVKAEQLLAQAKRGDLETFRIVADGVAAKEVEVWTSKRAEIENHLLAERALLDSMSASPPKNYDGVPLVGPSGRVTRWKGYGPNGYGVEEIAVLDGNRIVKRYPVDQCPPEILALAPESKN